MKKNITKSLLISLVVMPLLVYADAPIMLNLPKSGAPITRIGGGTRSVDKSSVINVQVLAPAQVGLTSQASPTLYWYISTVSPIPIEFSIVAENDGDLLSERTLPPVTKVGIQSIKLSELNVQLEKGKEYRWTIAAVINPENREKDVIASATIRREETNIGLTDTKQLANSGIWYDLLQNLYEQKSSQIAELLKQVDITLGTENFK